MDYALSFRTLAAQSGWEDKPFKLLYRKGLTAVLQSELACLDEGKTLEQFIDLSICIDNLMRARHAPWHISVHTQAVTVSSESEPMQIRFTRFTNEERERRIRNLLSLLWSIRPSVSLLSYSSCRSSSSMVSSNPDSINSLEVPIALMFNGKCMETIALIDLGAAGNFIDKVCQYS